MALLRFLAMCLQVWYKEGGIEPVKGKRCSKQFLKAGKWHHIPVAPKTSDPWFNDLLEQILTRYTNGLNTAFGGKIARRGVATSKARPTRRCGRT